MAKKGFLDGYQTYDSADGFGEARQWRSAFHTRMGKEEASTILKEQPQTPYEVLGISPEATPQEIKKAFRRLIAQWHPDKNPHREAEAEAMSKKIIAAYTILI